jgi:hypothetical protein
MRAACIAVVSALALSACAPSGSSVPGPAMTSAEPARQCFNIGQVQNFRPGHPAQLFVRAGRSDVYELDSGGGCTDLDFAIRVALVPDVGGASGSRLCTDDWARVIVPGSSTSNAVCRVRVMRKLTAEQVAALPAAHRP